MSESSQTRNGLVRYGAGGLVVVVLAAGIALGVSQCAGSRTSTPPAVTRPASASPAGTSACDEGRTRMSGTVSKAPEADWSIVGTMAAPGSRGSGPGEAAPGGFRRCFAHTPEGALMAAANFTAMMSAPELMGRMARDSVLPGPGRDAAIAKNFGASASAAPAGASVQIAGFQMIAYDGRSTQINIAVKVAGAGSASVPWQLGWSGGDWKFKVADDGEVLFDPTALEDMSGYITWGTS
ncbi:hypothetical protein [Acidipropionibacterium acidipropionici]|nr:hypothetical protein [Acidipropionibacterium acidipropionici]